METPGGSHWLGIGVKLRPKRSGSEFGGIPYGLNGDIQVSEMTAMCRI